MFITKNDVVPNIDVATERPFTTPRCHVKKEQAAATSTSIARVKTGFCKASRPLAVVMSGSGQRRHRMCVGARQSREDGSGLNLVALARERCSGA